MSGQRGYTIIEVVLFMAISSSLLGIAFIGFRERQETTQFSQAMQDIQSSIQDTLNDTQNGFYFSATNTTCDLTGPGSTPRVYSSSPATDNKRLGGDQNCVFLGKVLAFGTSADPSEYRVYTIVGDRQAGTTTQLAEPTIADPLTNTKLLRWGARVLTRSNITSPPAPGPKIYTNIIGSINGLNTTRQLPVLFTGDNFKLDRPDQELYIETAAAYGDPPSGRLAIGDAAAYTPAILCFESSDGSHEAQIEISPGGGQSLTVRLDFRDCEAA